jgi:hypothetical protein
VDSPFKAIGPASAFQDVQEYRGGIAVIVDKRLQSLNAMRRIPILLTIIAALASSFPPAAADPAVQVFVPLTIDYFTLDAALEHEIYNAPGGRAILWKGDNGCEFLYAENPRFAQSGPAAVALESDAQLGLGVPVGDQCLGPVAWQGIIAVEATPRLTPDLMLIFHVTDMNLYDSQHKKSLIVGRGFDLIKGNFIPRFETFKFDLRKPVDEFRALAEETAPPDQAERFKKTLATVHGSGPVIATSEGIKITLGLSAPAMAPAVASVPSGPLTPGELAAWNEKLDQWDAFIVFAIKQVGGAIRDRQVRADLLNVLLDGRYRLAQAIDQPPKPGGADPVRLLFLDQWQQLCGVIRKAAARGQLGDSALQLLSFISAGDALMAFDEAAPALGARISAADLRRLARIMAPGLTGDPLQFNYKQDPELQHIFGFAPLAETPGSVEPSDTEQGEPLPEASGYPSATVPESAETPSADSPHALSTPPVNSSPTSVVPVTPVPSSAVSPSARSAPEPFHASLGVSAPFLDRAPESRLLAAFRLLSPADAWAAPPPQTPDLKQLGERLRRAVVNESNVDRYTRDLSALLEAAAASEMTDDKPDPALGAAYRLIVKAAAWQESCWRQFVMAHGRIRFLESSTHDIGLMQVNRYVWRGFYNMRHIEWDIAYNAGAGSQILARLMISAQARNEAGADALARSVYAGYNGGPDDLNRWRSAKEPKEQREIDEAFWDKYRALKSGKTLNILKCAAEWGHTPGH